MCTTFHIISGEVRSSLEKETLRQKQDLLKYVASVGSGGQDGEFSLSVEVITLRETWIEELINILNVHIAI